MKELHEDVVSLPMKGKIHLEKKKDAQECGTGKRESTLESTFKSKERKGRSGG